MRKAMRALLPLLALAVMPASAQDNWQTNNIKPRRCGTSMLMERQLTNKDGKRRMVSASANYVPHTGTVTIPVILVNFKDVKLSVNNPREAFEQMFNSTTKLDTLGNGNERNNGSVAKYFADMSGGDFDLRFKVYEPVTVSRDETYYGGKNEDYNDDERPRDLVKEAVDSLMASGQVSGDDTMAFSSDGKTIDCVYIFYAGCGQNFGGDGTTVWANTGNAQNTYIGSKRVRWYSMAGELSPYKLDNNGNVTADGTIPMITGVGVTCHELSHALGLPDFYPTSKSAQIDNQEMEYWDLMDGGEYSHNGFCPTAYTAFEKNEMGWPVSIEELNDDKTVTIANSTEAGGTAYKITNPQNSNEYLLLECIQKRRWNRYQYGNGLLVYHVNKPNGDITINTRFNNTPNYPGMAVVPADGLCASSYVHNDDYPYIDQMRGDLFPGSGNLKTDTLNVTELSDAKPQPNFCWYNADKNAKLPTNKALKNIKYDVETGIVSFDYVHDVATAISNVNANRKAVNGRIYTIDGRCVGNDLTTLPSGLYIRDGKKIVK